MKTYQRTAGGFSFVAIFVLGVFLAPKAFASAPPQTRCEEQQRLFQEAKRLYGSGQKLLSAFHFSIVRMSDCDRSLSSRSWLGYALATYDLQERVEALAAIDGGVAVNTVDENDKRSLRMLKTWILNEPTSGLTEDQCARWLLWSVREHSDQFQTQLERLKAESQIKEEARSAYQRITTAPQKSLWVSGLSSAVLPGAGQAYVGNWQASGLALILNSLFLAATIEFSRNDMPAAALASGGVFSITYIGNIVSAVEGARGFNRTSRDPAETDLKMILFPELSF